MVDNAFVYKIDFSDSSKTGFLIQPGTTNVSTSLRLPGNGTLKWGEGVDESLLHLMENFANDTEPANAVEGQLWYNSVDKTLYVYGEGSPAWTALANGTSLAANYFTKSEADARYVEITGDTMSGDLTMSGGVVVGLPAAPSVDSEAASKKYVDDQIAILAAALAGSVTPGTIILSGVATFGTQPSTDDYLVCDGTSYDSVANPNLANLYSQIGTVFGGTGATDFHVPDLRGRFALGHNEGVVTPINSNRVTDYGNMNPGLVGGIENVQLSTAEMPNHTHNADAANNGQHSHTGSTAPAGRHRHSGIPKIVSDCDSGDGDREHGPGGYTDYAEDHSHTLTINNSVKHSHAITVDPAGSSSYHSNTPPYVVLRYLIKT